MAVWGQPAACFAAAALALAEALWMRAAVRGGEAGGDHEVNEDNEEEVVLRDAGCAVMRAGAALRAAAGSAAANTGRMEAISSGSMMGAGGSKGRNLAAWGADLDGSGMRGRRRAAVSTDSVWLGRARAICEGARISAHGGGKVVWAAFRCRGGTGLGLRGFARWGWVCRGAWGALWRVCAGCRVLVAAGHALWGRPWRACVGFRDRGAEDPCRGARRSARRANVGHWVESREGRCRGCGAGLECGDPVFLFARGGGHVWSSVGLEVWRWSLPSTAVAARI